ncbi:hypothetical protein MSC49_29980 [Methylosinus sp. C49]|uniref:Mu transposase C-terminal domain-containing protein n=1 Tax=Methylosinus sp. C49 TaxID=2699395 RepID=UPI001366CB3C|nr:Mu transposase C-terminal domain-containing protein [Methylosinus sp. C49]BBU63063.1 hypothetical protein MSC49_29980 [Methylosinus sp. C49]
MTDTATTDRNFGQARFRLHKGDCVEIDGIMHAFESQDGGGTLLRSLGSAGVRRLITHAEFWRLYFDRSLKVHRARDGKLDDAVAANMDRSIDSFRPRDREEALRRLDYVEIADMCMSPEKENRRGRFPKRPEGYARVAKLVSWLRRRQRARIEGVSASTLPREYVGGSTLRGWHWRWRNSGKAVVALAPCHDSKGSDKTRLVPAVVDIMWKWIRKHYLIMEGPPAKSIHKAMCGDIDAINERDGTALAHPSYDAFLRFIDDNVTPYEQTYYRKGQKRAQQDFPFVKKAPRATLPLEVVEIDHTPLDILLVDKDGKESKGDRRRKKTYRVWLTLARCQATRMVFGYHISRDCPSWTSVMAVLRMGIMPKDLTGVGAVNPWPVFSTPRMLKVDNGPEFHSLSLRAACGQLRIRIRRMPRGRPHLKGMIERGLGIIAQDFLSFLPGRTFSDRRERGDYDSRGRAAVTWEDLDRLLRLYIVDELHNRSSPYLFGRTPLQMWEHLGGAGLEMPPAAADLDVILSLVIQRTVTSLGVTFLGLSYQSKELQTIRRREGHIGQMLMVKVDPYDLGAVLVLDEGSERGQGRWISVPAVEPDLCDGVSLAQWKETIALARQHVAENQRVPLSILRAARKRLVEAGARLGAKPIKMTQKDIDWYRDSVDDVWFDIARDPSTEGDAPCGDGPVPFRRRRRKPADPGDGRPATAGVGDGGHSLPGAPPDAEPAAAERMEDETADDDRDGVDADADDGSSTASDWDDPSTWED